jgi:hypothetical protein
MPLGGEVMLLYMALVPAILFGVLGLMIPALYIGAATAGIAPSARTVLDAAGRALCDMGRILLGLAPALAFLLATAAVPSALWPVAVGVIALGVLISMKALYGALAAANAPAGRILAVFVPWALVSLGIAGHLLVTALVSYA